MRIFETNSRLKAAIISYLGHSQKCLQQVKFQRVKELNLFAFNYIFDIPYQLPYYFRVECATWLPETREPKKKSVKAGTGRGRIEIFRLQVSRPRPEEVQKDMVFLRIFLADPKTQKCHFNKKKYALYNSLLDSEVQSISYKTKVCQCSSYTQKNTRTANKVQLIDPQVRLFIMIVLRKFMNNGFMVGPLCCEGLALGGRLL